MCVAAVSITAIQVERNKHRWRRFGHAETRHTRVTLDDEVLL